VDECKALLTGSYRLYRKSMLQNLVKQVVTKGQGLPLVHHSAQPDLSLSLTPPSVFHLHNCDDIFGKPSGDLEWFHICYQGLPLVHFSAQPEPFIWQRDSTQRMTKCAKPLRH
jgi:hypothetical protein